MPQQFEGRAQYVRVDRQIRIGAPGRRNEPRRAKSEDRDADHACSENCAVARVERRPAGDRAAQNREEGRALDERIARRKLLPRQMIGQDAVFDGPKQRAGDAEENERAKERREIGEEKARRRQSGDGDVGDAQPAHDARLVIFVGEFSADRREKKEGGDEGGAGERDERRAALGHVRQDQEHERVLEEIVVEGRKELTPEQRRETPRSKERMRHVRTSGRGAVTFADDP